MYRVADTALKVFWMNEFYTAFPASAPYFRESYTLRMTQITFYVLAALLSKS